MAASARETPAVEEWQPAQLIPTAGIRGHGGQERRATSCLLAVVGAVPEFGKALLSGELGAPRGRVSTFIEVPLEDEAGKVSIPDGAAVVERAGEAWSCLFEAKTGDARLKPEQVNRYLDVARIHGFDVVVTISNEITGSSSESPVDVDRRKTRAVTLKHLSWSRVITEAVVQHRHRGVSDPDQAWILGELLNYLDRDASGAGGFSDMGEKWVSVRKGARNGTLRAGGAGVRSVAARWEQFAEFLCLRMSRDLGREVRTRRRGTPEERIDKGAKELAETGKLVATFKVPDAVGAIRVGADLRAQLVTTSVAVKAPEKGRPLTRINWLVRQLRDAPDDLRMDVSFASTSKTTSALMCDVRENPRQLLSPTDAKREPRSFNLALSRKMGTKQGKEQGSFVAETRRQAVDFYRELVQDVRAWQPRPPRFPRKDEEPEEQEMQGGAVGGGTDVAR